MNGTGAACPRRNVRAGLKHGGRYAPSYPVRIYCDFYDEGLRYDRDTSTIEAQTDAPR